MPAACATTGSTRAATGATGWATSSGSWPRPRSARSTSPAPSPILAAGRPALGAAGGRRSPPAAPSTGRRSTSARHAEGRSEPEPLRARPALIDQVTRLAGEAVRPRCRPRPRRWRSIRDAYDHHLVALWELRDDRLVPRAVAVADRARPERLVERPRDVRRPRGGARRAPRPATERRDRAATDRRRGSPARSCRASRPELAGGDRRRSDGPWGVLHLVGETPASLGPLDREVAAVIARTPRHDRRGRRQREDAVGHQLHRAEALRRVAGDIGSRLDLDRILSGLVDHAMVLFEADRGAVFLQPPGRHGPSPRSAAACRRRSSRASATSRPSSLPAAAVAAAPSAVRRRLPRRPARPGRPCRGRPGGLRHDLHRAAVRRRRAARPAQRLPRRAAPLDRRRPRDHGRAGDPGQRRDPGRPGLRAHGDVGRPARSRSSSSGRG